MNWFASVPTKPTDKVQYPTYLSTHQNKIKAITKKDNAAYEGYYTLDPRAIAFLDEIGIDEFAKCDLRVAKVLECEPIKKAKKLLKLTLDDGSGTHRTVASGIAQYYKPEELVNKSVIVVANLKPVTLCGVESSGMILAADTPDGVKVVFPEGIPAGSKIRQINE